MGERDIKIHKVNESEESDRKKTMKKTRVKTFPAGVLKMGSRKTARKIEGVAAPSRSPPFKSEGKIRILTAFGEKQKRKTTQRTLRNLTDAQVREKLRRSKFPIGPKTPPELAKLILISGTEAGMIPSQ